MSFENAIKVLQVGVPDKPLMDTYKLIALDHGRAVATNGNLAVIVSVPEFDGINTCVDGKKFIRACQTVGEAGNFSETEKYLTVSAGRFRVRFAKVDSGAYPFPVLPDDVNEHHASGLIDALNTLRPFIGEAGKTARWSCGVRLKTGLAYATNNVVLLRKEIELNIGELDVVVPTYAVDALIKIGQDPTDIWTDGKSIWFGFDGSMWIQSLLIDAPWPEVDNMLTAAENELPQALHADIKNLIPFCEDSALQKIVLHDGKITTSHGETIAELDGYHIGEGTFRAGPLANVLKVATHADFGGDRVPFIGEKLTGIFIGIR